MAPRGFPPELTLAPPDPILVGMETVIRIQCAQCGSKLNAKSSLAGQTRKCPKCGGPITIPAAASGAAESPPAESPPPPAAPPAAGAAAEATPPAAPHEPQPIPRRLNRHHRYFICDKSRVVARWEANGQGWMLRNNTSFIPARAAPEQLATHGEFKLVELRLTHDDQGQHLVGLAFFKLVNRWPLINLDKGDDKILGSVTGRGPLTREQKSAVRQGLRDYVGRPIWAEAQDLLDFLGGNDGHSSEVGRSGT